MPRPRPSAARRRAVVLALLAGLGLVLSVFGLGCGGAAAPREEKVQFTELSAPPPPPAPEPPQASTARAVPFRSSARPAARDEADFAGAGVAGAATVVTEDAAAAESAPSAPAAPPAGGAAQGAGAPAAAAPPAMLIRNGTASVEVDSLEAAVAQVRALAARVGGYVANSTLAVGRAQVRSATLELRVPAARFDALLGGLAPFGRVERVDVTAEDVGEEYVDGTARAANARRLEARLVELLATRTGRLQDVLAVERELARVREDVERYEGRLRYLRAHAATSTLAVTVHERPPLLAGAPDRSPLADAARAAGRNFVGLVAAVVAGSGVWAPLGALAYAAWRWRRRRAGALERAPQAAG